MKQTRNKWYAGILLAGAFWFVLSGCSENGLTGPDNVVTGAAKGLTTEEINVVNWKPAVQEAIDFIEIEGVQAPTSLTKSTDDGDDSGEWAALAWDYIWKFNGGTVGGEITFGNKVDVPAHAYPQLARLFVVAVTNADPGDNYGAAVEFLPSQQFLRPVTVTLSWDYLDFSGDPNDLVLYWQNEETGLWVEVPGATIDPVGRTISGQVNHFTKFLWGLEDDFDDDGN